MTSALGRAPTIDELAAAVDMDDDEVTEMLDHARPVLSLDFPVLVEIEDAPVNTESSKGARYAPLSAVLIDTEEPGPFEAIVPRLLKEQLDESLGTLSDREAGVISLRFGLSGDEPRTLDEIGQAYGVTRERIRQIEKKTLDKLRHPSRSQVLRDFADLPPLEAVIN